jgi:hypothetical protein
VRYIYGDEGEKIMLFATIGCSFTRGERLFYHRYIEDDKLSQFKSWSHWKSVQSRSTIPIFGQVPDEDGHHMMTATQQDKRFMLDISYTGLLSKRLNCEYFTKSGDNFENIDRYIPEWVEVSRTVTERKLDFIILQLTDPCRDVKYRHANGSLGDIYGTHQEFWEHFDKESPEEKEKLLHYLEVEIPEQTVSKVLEVNKLCKDNDIDLFVWSWETELAKMLKDEDFFVPIIYEGKSYISYSHMRKWCKHGVGFDQIFDSKDTHPNKFFNRVLCDSIIIKLKEKQII